MPDPRYAHCPECAGGRVNCPVCDGEGIVKVEDARMPALVEWFRDDCGLPQDEAERHARGYIEMFPNG